MGRYRRTSTSKNTVLAWLCAAAFAILFATPAAAKDEQTIVFYDPDANFEAIPRILQGLNSYLSKNLPGYKLRVTGDATAMLDVVRTSHAPYVITAEEYLSGNKDLANTPLLVPESKGSVFYHKILVDRGVGAVGDLKGKRIAAASGDPHGPGASQKVLGVLRTAGLQVDGALFLGTTKDIDALLAVVFAQADAALVTSSSLDRLKTINPTAAASMRPVWQSANIMRPPLVAIKGFETAGERDTVVAAFKKLPTDPEGRAAMSALGFDAWVPYSADLAGGGK